MWSYVVNDLNICLNNCDRCIQEQGSDECKRLHDLYLEVYRAENGMPEELIPIEDYCEHNKCDECPCDHSEIGDGCTLLEWSEEELNEHGFTYGNS